MDTFNLIFSLITLFIGINNCQEMLGPGKWTILSIERCEDDNIYPTKMDVAARRVNRSLVAFSCKAHYDRDIDQSVAIQIDICKYVDGGCKPYQVLADASAINFLTQYAKENMAAALNLTKLYNWPIPKGDYSLDDYIFNLKEAPKSSVYGDFIATGYLLSNAVKFVCAQVAVKFDKYDDEDYDDD